jgi:14-3-3 protein epsilon
MVSRGQGSDYLFVEMVDHVAEFSQVSEDELTIEERNILSVAFKNVVGTRRAAWRVISLIERKENKKGSTANADKAKRYKQDIEEELTGFCHRILTLVNKDLIPKCKSDEGKVFLFKMKGDYYRYIAEYASGGDKTEAAKDAENAYAFAHDLAEKELPSTHPLRLGLALNYSVYYYEIM